MNKIYNKNDQVFSWSDNACANLWCRRSTSLQTDSWWARTKRGSRPDRFAHSFVSCSPNFFFRPRQEPVRRLAFHFCHEVLHWSSQGYTKASQLHTQTVSMWLARKISPRSSIAALLLLPPQNSRIVSTHEIFSGQKKKNSCNDLMLLLALRQYRSQILNSFLWILFTQFTKKLFYFARVKIRKRQLALRGKYWQSK